MEFKAWEGQEGQEMSWLTVYHDTTAGSSSSSSDKWDLAAHTSLGMIRRMRSMITRYLFLEQACHTTASSERTGRRVFADVPYLYGSHGSRGNLLIKLQNMKTHETDNNFLESRAAVIIVTLPGRKVCSNLRTWKETSPSLLMYYSYRCLR